MKPSAIALGYCKQRMGLLLLFLIQFGVLILVLSLYDQALVPALYATLIICAIILLYGLLDYRTYHKTVRALEMIKEQAAHSLEELPPASEPQQMLYGEILKVLEHRCQTLAQKAKERESATAQYYTIWSHQAKTPLSAMHLLLQEEVPTISALQQELLKAEQYVDMALQYQRLNYGSSDLVLRIVPVADLVKQAVKEVATLFIHKKIKLVLGDLEGSILTDKKWFLFVLEQILTNGVKYTSHGSVTIWYAEEILYIRDTGMGIRPEDLPRIFEWGYTGYNGHGESRSTGIGLSLCKQALTMLGHSITIASELGFGTTVSIGVSRRELEIE